MNKNDKLTKIKEIKMINKNNERKYMNQLRLIKKQID